MDNFSPEAPVKFTTTLFIQLTLLQCSQTSPALWMVMLET